MSLAIDIRKIVRVLIGNKWYPVEDFGLDAYEYIETWENPKGHWKEEALLLGGAEKAAGVPATGFGFKSGGRYICGPISAIQAVEIEVEDDD
jgi:hypothetical protein